MKINLEKYKPDTYIHRIISLKKLLELFSEKKNILVKPKKWEDPFENFILKSNLKYSTGESIENSIHDEIYGQCWSLHRASDAMWRIYSKDGNGVRIRTTIEGLLGSLIEAQPDFTQSKCCIGKVEYLNTKNLDIWAGNLFKKESITWQSMFKSLLVKRKAFQHENEIRLLFHNWDSVNITTSDTYAYNIDPYKLINRITIDPRKTYMEFKKIRETIKENTGYTGSIQRSKLYALPENKTLIVKKIEY